MAPLAISLSINSVYSRITFVTNNVGPRAVGVLSFSVWSADARSALRDLLSIEKSLGFWADASSSEVNEAGVISRFTSCQR
jgi:hypothetical protein